MTNTALPERPRQAITDALGIVGYDRSLLDHDIPISFTRDSNGASPVPLAAFWRKPFDQLTSAIGVRWIRSEESAEDYVRELGKDLWTPFNVIADPYGCQLWETFPTSGNGTWTPSLLQQTTYDSLASALYGYAQQLRPEPVRVRKERYRQMALYEIGGTRDTFTEWAFQPTRDHLGKLLADVTQKSIPEHLDTDQTITYWRWLLRLLGVRIAWDKKWLPYESRTSTEELTNAAQRYPSPLESSPHLRGITEWFAEEFRSIDLSMADGGLLSNVLQTRGLLKQLRDEWKLHPTPPDLAWRMLEAIPLEAVPAEKRLVWDGTCGTGTLLVAAMDRLRQLDGYERDDAPRVTHHIRGNDKQPLLTDLTRLALDTASGRPDGPEWSIDSRDVLGFSVSQFAERPTVIVGNPPFQATGRRTDYAVTVIRKYIEILEPGGLLAVVLPRPLLGTSGREATQLRESLLEHFELFEVWELPQGFAPGVSSEAAVICARKRYPHETQAGAVVWRLFDSSRRDRRRELIANVIASPEVWLQSEAKSLEPPLMVRLRKELGECSRLSDYVPANLILQGIILGKEGRSDILSERESADRPFVSGRTGMEPFYLPWHEDPLWIRYNSPRLHRPRRESERLFQRRKVLIARRSTGGSPWAVRAAVDSDCLYPSDDFISVVPEPHVSCDLVAGLFNSVLINCWLRLANPARNIRVGECTSIPIPPRLDDRYTAMIESLASDLAVLRKSFARQIGDPASLRREIGSKTLELDEAVYDAYQVDEDLRAEIAHYFVAFGKSRPGFDTPLVTHREAPPPSAEKVFSAQDQDKMRALFEARDDRGLNSEEASDLGELVARWERARLLSGRA